MIGLGAAIALLPFATPLAYFPSDGDPGVVFRVFLPDLPLVALAAVAAARAIARRDRALSGPIALALAMGALLVASAVAHPSPRAFDLALRSLAGVTAGLAVARLAHGPQRALVFGTLAASAVLQSLLGIAQATAGTPLGLTFLGEVADPLLRVAGAPSPRGTMHHSNVLAAFGLVAASACVVAAARARRPLPWLAVAALAVVPVGMSYSRNALVALAIGVAALSPAAIRGSGVHRIAIAALVLGAGIPALVNVDGWIARGERTVTSVPDRPTLIAQALPIVAEHPLLGVGPGRYGEALDDLARRSPGTVAVRQPPHSVPVLVAAEAGIPAGVAIFGAMAWLAARALRGGGVAIATFAMFAPFALNDLIPYIFAQGPLLLGIWLGLMTVASHRAREAG